jgi:hypothetical protein
VLSRRAEPFSDRNEGHERGGAPVRRRLLRWGGWFALVNAGLLALIGVRYLWHYTAPAVPTAWLYVLVATAGHWAALAYIPFLLVLAPASLLVPRPRVILPLGVALASLGVTVTLLDSLIFAEHRYHLSFLTFSLLESSTWMFTGLYLVVIGVIEAVLAAWLWRRGAALPRHRVAPYLATALVVGFLGSHVVYLWADARYYVPVTSFTHYLPLLHRLKASALIAKLANRDQVFAQGLTAAADRAASAVLRYPLAPLACTGPTPTPNVLVIVIDAMRADSLTPEVAPRLSAFAEHAIRFEHHVSGGNASRGGMFSLFYGLPPTYWDDFASLVRPAVLMDLFQRRGYQLGLFVAAPLNGAVGLERTAFARVPNLRLRTQGDGYERDRVLTDDWYAWLQRRDAARPFFGFLYYDAAQQQRAPEADRRLFPRPPGASRQQAKYADYRAAVHYADALAGEVIDDLERRGLLEHTVLVVTSDHGTEFDESGQGFAGHGTAFSAFQLRTPFLLRWPGRPAGRVVRRTSHNDVAPTLLLHLFGCTNPPSDYSSGHDLFSDAQWDWIIAASYDDFALVEPDRVTVVGRTGYFEIRDGDYRVLPGRIRADVLGAAMHEMSRFYR